MAKPLVRYHYKWTNEMTYILTPLLVWPVHLSLSLMAPTVKLKHGRSLFKEVDEDGCKKKMWWWLEAKMGITL